jgi:hypothetical protein
MIDKATPARGTEQWMSPVTMIANCMICNRLIIRIPADGMEPSYPWYHPRTGRVLCFVGIHPSETLVDRMSINL